MPEMVLDGDPLLPVIVSRRAIRERLLAQLLILAMPCAGQSATRVSRLAGNGGGAATVLDEELDGPSLLVWRIHARSPFPSPSGTEHRQHPQMLICY